MGEDRVLWVSGGGSGMGRAAALSAAAAGWRVAVSGRRPEALAETVAEIERVGGTALALPLDVTDGSAVALARDAVLLTWGRIDALVLSAGLNTPRRSWAAQSVGEFESIVQTNLVAVVRVVDAALPSLRERGGMVVVVSSYAGWHHNPGSGVAYSASKTALAAVCRTLNEQEAASGVRACHLCPGDVDSEFLSMRPEVPDARAREAMLQPADIGRAVQFVLDSPAHVRIDELVITPTGR